MIKKVIGVLVMGFLVAFVLFGIYSLIVREPAFSSPLPDEDGINVIFITPETTP